MTKTKGKWTRLVAVAVAVVLCFGMAALASGCFSKQKTDADGNITFMDDAGREVKVPENVELVIPSGHPATQVLLTLCPEKMASVSSELSPDVIKYMGVEGLADLPVTGAAFGSKGDLNKETVASLLDGKSAILVDTGEKKDGIGEDLDALQSQLGIPCVFIETKLEDYGSAYEKLGELLGCEKRGEELSKYCKDAYSEVTAAMEKVGDNKVDIAYIVGTEGVNAIAKDSYQGGVVDLVANNVVVVENASGKGSGNPISLEQLANWNPETIIFQAGGLYDQVGNMSGWQALPAIQSGSYYEVPDTPYCWMNNPPTVNQVMGMQWLPRLLYPDQFKDSIADVTKSYYKTFYGYSLTDDEVNALIAKANVK